MYRWKRWGVGKSTLSIYLLAFLINLACDSLLPAPTLDSISPDAEYSDAPQVLTLKGEGFYKQLIRQLSRGSDFKTNDTFNVTLKGTTVTGKKKNIPLKKIERIDNNTLKATLPKNSPAGVYTVFITTPEGRQCKKKNAFTILVESDTDNPESNTDSDSSTDSESDTALKMINSNKSCDTNEQCETHCSGNSCSFECSSNAECTYSCDAQTCNLQCNDESVCELTLCQASRCSLFSTSSETSHITCSSANCSAENSGSGIMHVNCASACHVKCYETSPCIVQCVDRSNCHIQCEETLTWCEDEQVYTCNTPCPN